MKRKRSGKYIIDREIPLDVHNTANPLYNVEELNNVMEEQDNSDSLDEPSKEREKL